MRPLLLSLLIAALVGCDDNRLGPGQTPADTTTPAPAGFFTSLSAGNNHACGLTAQGAVYCWGWALGGLGNGDPRREDAIRPVRVATSNVMEKLSAGASTNCAIANAAVYCWGSNEYGQLGISEPLPLCGLSGLIACNPTPAPIESAVGAFTQVSAGGGHTCAVATTGAAYCWGYAAYGRLGVDSTRNQFKPIAVTTTLRFSTVETGGSHTCGLAVDGAAYCWGFGEGGQIGNGLTPTSQIIPTAVSGNMRFTAIDLGSGHACALATAGSVWCWGANGNGQVGNGSTTNTLTPMRAGNLLFTSLSTGAGHSCGIDLESRAWCWGDNEGGQLGDGTTTDRSTPVAVQGNLQFRQITAGSSFTCGLTLDSRAYCWGLNYRGALGIGTDELHVPAPRRVAAPL